MKMFSKQRVSARAHHLPHVKNHFSPYFWVSPVLLIQLKVLSFTLLNDERGCHTPLKRGRRKRISLPSLGPFFHSSLARKKDENMGGGREGGVWRGQFGMQMLLNH